MKLNKKHDHFFKALDLQRLQQFNHAPTIRFTPRFIFSFPPCSLDEYILYLFYPYGEWNFFYNTITSNFTQSKFFWYGYYGNTLVLNRRKEITTYFDYLHDTKWFAELVKYPFVYKYRFLNYEYISRIYSINKKYSKRLKIVKLIKQRKKWIQENNKLFNATIINKSLYWQLFYRCNFFFVGNKIHIWRWKKWKIRKSRRRKSKHRKWKWEWKRRKYLVYLNKFRYYMHTIKYQQNRLFSSLLPHPYLYILDKLKSHTQKIYKNLSYVQNNLVSTNNEVWSNLQKMLTFTNSNLNSEGYEDFKIHWNHNVYGYITLIKYWSEFELQNFSQSKNVFACSKYNRELVWYIGKIFFLSTYFIHYLIVWYIYHRIFIIRSFTETTQLPIFVNLINRMRLPLTDRWPKARVKKSFTISSFLLLRYWRSETIIANHRIKIVKKRLKNPKTIFKKSEKRLKKNILF